MDFNALHQQNQPLLLANVWDASSAQAAQQAGYQALGSSSAAIAAMLGYEDGEEMSFDELFYVVSRIKTVSELPLSVDLEAGYSATTSHIIDNIRGLDYSRFPKITVIENKMKVDEMVTVRDITLTSTCEHHFVTIDGKATVAYIPKDSVIGLSKINRIVQFFAQRPQVQERLTQQILIALQTLLGTNNVAVSIDAVHYCVKARGIRDATSATTTTSLGGLFKSSQNTRQEFLRAVRHHD